MSSTVDVTSFEQAPSLLDGAMDQKLTPQQCDLDYWITNVAQGTWSGLVNGHRPGMETPQIMRRDDSPFRHALLEELAFRSIAEEKATRAISHLVEMAPTLATMEFFSTQLIDEARHARVFRRHLLELGVESSELDGVIDTVAGADCERILVPLERFGLEVARRGDFLGGVATLTILVEGVLAPLAELSERKWRPIDPAAADIERGAGIDEIRHLTVGSEIIRQAVERDPSVRPRLAELLDDGQQLWASLPVVAVVQRREELFQQGLDRWPEVVGDYELCEGRRLLDTTVEERLALAMEWSSQMRASRLAYMGIDAPD